MTEPSSSPGGDSRLALTAGVGCYLIWGFVPLVFQAIAREGPGSWEILAHRSLWSIPIAAAFVAAAGQWRAVAKILRTPRIMAVLAASAGLIAVNWITYIWAVLNGRVLEASLGYYITPLLAMASGAVIFRERINPAGLLAIALAVAGVALQTAALGRLPFVSVCLGAVFAAYGVLRKQVAAEAQTGLLIECLILGAPAAAFLAWLAHHGQGHFLASPAAAAWLMFSGVITAVPLVMFSWSARRMPMSATGFLQFITPTIAFVIGVLQGESFTPLRALSFGLIWAGVAVFAWSAWVRARPAGLQSAE